MATCIAILKRTTYVVLSDNCTKSAIIIQFQHHTYVMQHAPGSINSASIAVGRREMAKFVYHTGQSLLFATICVPNK